jgi:hypothetical protein
MQDRALQLFAVTLVCLILTWITVPLRCFVRARLNKSFGLDGWFMVASLVSDTLIEPYHNIKAHDHTVRFHHSLWNTLCGCPLWHGLSQHRCFRIQFYPSNKGWSSINLHLPCSCANEPLKVPNLGRNHLRRKHGNHQAQHRISAPPDMSSGNISLQIRLYGKHGCVHGGGCHNILRPCISMLSGLVYLGSNIRPGDLPQS